MARHLALDHLTAVDAGPERLMDLAAASGCQAVSLFLHPLAVLPDMPAFDLVVDRAARQRCAARLEDRGLTVDLVYPFTLAGATDPESLVPALAAAAQLKAFAINVLVYDRQPDRRLTRLARLTDLAREHGLATAVEFFPASQVASLSQALALVEAVGAPSLGVNIDLLHLVRSGEGVAALAEIPPRRVLYGQLCDGPLTCPIEARDHEAAFERLAPGEGEMDVAGFVAALPATTRLSVEAPMAAALAAGTPIHERVRRAVNGARAALSYDLV